MALAFSILGDFGGVSFLGLPGGFGRCVEEVTFVVAGIGCGALEGAASVLLGVTIG